MSYLRNSTNYMWSTSFTLGKGATGSVYQGVHKRTGELVAVKSFYLDGYSDPLELRMRKKTGELVAVKTFNHHGHSRPLELQMREFEVMKVLSHENIVKMVAIEEESQSQKKVLVMELCNGGSLFTILDDPQNSYGLEEEEFLCVLKDLSAGMKYLRDNNIIHRDLKPGNIMKYISEDGRSIYKLTDFGAARVLDDDQQFMSLYGTEEYLHPDMYERAVLRHPANKSFRATVDLWSIGVTFYHVATGSLPFRPFGGRQNRDTMHYIITNKSSGVISGVQHSENGPIEWSRELPKTCLLNQGLRDLVTVLLAGILECNDQKMWTFDQFFECVTDIITRKVFHVFYMNEGKEISLYMQPHKMLQDLKDEIATHTQVSPQNQLLLFDKALFLSQINPSSEVSTFPSTSFDQPLILVHMENTDVKDLTRFGIVSAFPMFPSSLVSTDNDACLAKTCCSVAHAVKRLIVKLVRCRELLLRIPKILLLLSVENVTKLCSNSEILKQKVEDVNYRCELFEKSSAIISQFIASWPNMNGHENHDSSVRIICNRIKEVVSEKTKSKDQVKQKVVQLLSSIHLMKQRVLVSKRLQSEWDQALSECSSLAGCIERADTYVGKMRDSWQVFIRDKTIKVLSAHDQQFHMLERVKIQQTSKKFLTLLQEECMNACLQASNKLDEWYSGMQAVMVQCRCLEGDLASVNNDVKSFSSSLQQSESESFQNAEMIISALRPTEEVPKISTSLAESNVPNVKQVPMKNGIEDVRKYKEMLSKLQNVQKGQQEMWQVIEGNRFLIERFLSLFKKVTEDNNTENDGSAGSS